MIYHTWTRPIFNMGYRRHKHPLDSLDNGSKCKICGEMAIEEFTRGNCEPGNLAVYIPLCLLCRPTEAAEKLLNNTISWCGVITRGLYD